MYISRGSNLVKRHFEKHGILPFNCSVLGILDELVKRHFESLVFFHLIVLYLYAGQPSTNQISIPVTSRGRRAELYWIFVFEVLRKLLGQLPLSPSSIEASISCKRGALLLYFLKIKYIT
jgi:hypothetical protein